MKKFFKQSKNKKSILSLALAILFAFSLNVSPISLISKRIAESSSAYSSKPTQTYYGVDGVSVVTSEQNIGSANYVNGTNKYFENSSNNYNIYSKYTEMFDKLFKKYADKYLSALDENAENYNHMYSKYLEHLGFSSLSAYYNARSSSLEVSSFMEYFEKVTTNKTEWTAYNNEGVEESFELPALANSKSNLYNGFANYLYYPNNQMANEDGNISSEDDFYAVSKSYKRVKDYFDEIILNTTVIYSYDGTTQNDYVAAIIANNAPVSQAYYYVDGDFEEVAKTNFSYVQEAYMPENQTTYYLDKVFYFGPKSELANGSAKAAYDEFIKDYKITTTDSEEIYASDLDNDLFGYRLIQPGEFGYMDSTHKTYYKYSNVPFESSNTSSTGYTIYVVDENVTPDEKATYDSLYQVAVVSSAEIDADKNNLVSAEKSKDGFASTKGLFYIQVPHTDKYFKKLFSTVSDLTYTNSVDLFTDDNGDSKIYLKVSQNFTSTSFVVYIDNTKLEAFNDRYPNYSYTVVGVEAEELTNKDYIEVSKSYSNYYKDDEDFTLYFKQNRNYFTETQYEYEYEGEGENKTVVYEKEIRTNVEYETTTVASTQYDNFNVYVLVDTDETTIQINGKNYHTITAETLEAVRNLYVEVPSTKVAEVYGETEVTNKLYFKHAEKTVEQLYVVDDSENAKDSEVYKNLNYKVLTTDEYKAYYFAYSEVTSNDANYNQNFKLYYKLANVLTDASNYSANSSLFVQNLITEKNAVYIIDDSLTATDKIEYRGNFYTPLTTTEFEEESDLYVLINELDANYNSIYTKLYYKYKQFETENNKVYVYSSSQSVLYDNFYNTDADYNANDYDLIQVGDPNYVAGTNLYYKKNRIEKTVNIEQNTYYYYKNTSSVTLNANSYYALSFYVYTNANYYNENEELITDGRVQASLYIEDSKGAISNLSIEHIETNGTWQKYVAFISTDTLTASTISISMYMGDKNSVAGNLTNVEKINGTVLFDEIKVTLIGETDYNTQSIDGEKVKGEVKIYETKTVNLPTLSQEAFLTAKDADDKYIYELVDNYTISDNLILIDTNTVYYLKHVVDENNKVVDDEYETENNEKVVYVYVGTEEAENTKAVTVKTNPTTKYNVDKFSNPVNVVDNTMILPTETLVNRTNYVESDNAKYNFDNENLANQLNSLQFAGNEDGYTVNNDWHYYISRNHSGQGNYELLKAYQKAYSENKAEVKVVTENSIDKSVKEEDVDTTEIEEDETVVEDEVLTIENTFNSNNKVLKISNKDKLKSLGVVSTPFTVNQLEYYKVTVWVYSPDKDATATIKLESILKTASTTAQGSLLSVEASKVKAYLADYDTVPTNEYSWIPVSLYVEGNAFESKEVKIVLLADENSTVYFDNITVEKVTSSAYDTASSDSDTLTYCLSLSPSSSLLSNGITNGYFNLMTVTGNYGTEVDYTLPRNAENWTVSTTNSEELLAGVVPTSKEYQDKENNFFTKYNGGEKVNSNGNNVYAIYAPQQISSPLDSTLESKYNVTHNYKVYSTSISLSSASVYAISFEFMAGYEFNGNLVANIYSGSVSTKNLVSSMTVENVPSEWNKYTFYVQTGLDSATIYLEIGVENATGTAFIQKASCVKSSESTINAIRDNLVKEDNVATATNSINEYESLKYVRFVNLVDKDFSLHTDKKNEFDLYESKNYTDSNVNDTTFTVGKSGTKDASYYTSSTETYYKVEIKSIDFIKANGEAKEIATDADEQFYIKEFVDETSTSYKLYSDSMFTVEVLGFDVSGNGKIENEELNNFSITKAGSTVKVTLNETDTDATTITKTNYQYKFNDDVVFDNVIIPASELNNNYSKEVLILANNNSSDVTTLTNYYKLKLSSSSYYVLKVYVKTSDLGDKGLNINIDSVTVNWENINTTKMTNADENGFVCYELWISTNTSSFDSVTLTLTLGAKGSSCQGYALVAGIDLNKIDTETLFNEYCEAKKELYVENDSNSIAQRYYGVKSDSTDSTDTDKDKDKETESSSVTWATFFYVVSSLLLGVVLIMALVAIIIKRHPIKRNRKVADDSFIVIDTNKDKSKKAKSEKVEEQQNEEAQSDIDVAETPVEEKTEETNDDEEVGF